MSDFPFTSFAAFRTLMEGADGPDSGAVDNARARNGQLTKPPGALGRLEDLSIWYAGWRGVAAPRIEAPQVVVFAGNHGIAARGVSAFPSDVTAQMVLNFEAGGAAINQLAGLAGARLDVVALDLDRPTADFTEGPAMSEAETVAALGRGWTSLRPDSDVLVVGEMGIGNTTSAAAIAALIIGGPARDWIGRGTGIDDAGLDRKAEVVEAALGLHGNISCPLDILARVGGREIAAMTGALAAARLARVPVLLDGFIACASALVLHGLNPVLLDHAVAGHRSAEAAHGRLLEHLGKEPLLSLGLRLGEGSGAALAIQILRGALACHSGMATFAEAGVSKE